MIGRLKRWLLSSLLFIRKPQSTMIRMLWDGKSVIMGTLMLNLFTIPLLVRMILNSIGKPFGRLKLLDEFLFLCGLRLKGRFSLLIILCGDVISWLSGVVCVVAAGKLGTIFWFIVLLLQPYGTRFYALLGFFRFCLTTLQLFFSVGITALESTILRFGIWCLYA